MALLESGQIGNVNEIRYGITILYQAVIDREVAAIEALLWRWKTPLAREWYPFLFGLKHDLLLSTGNLPGLRIHKTQTAALAQHLGIGPASMNDKGNG